MNEKKHIEDEINFKNLLKNPLRLFGWVYPYIVGIILVIGIFYIKNLDQISFNTVPPKISETKFVKDVEQKKGSVVPAVDLNLISSPTSYLLTRGRELYDANCQSCHGAKGEGDGSAGLTLNPPPRNFISEEGWTNGRTFYNMYATLEVGIAERGMAAYEYLSPEDRIAMIHFIRTLTQFPPVTDEEIQNLEFEYRLSEEKISSNRIPIQSAMEKLAEEKRDQKEIGLFIYSFVLNHPNSEGAELINRVNGNGLESLTYLIHLGNGLEYAPFREALLLDGRENGLAQAVFTLSDGETQSLYNFIREYSQMDI